MGHLDLDRTKRIFKELFEKVDGRALSLKTREEQELKSKSFVYGEVVPESFYELISDLDPQPGQIFYDLGSGTGKAVILAALLWEFKKCIGIELLDSLYNASKEVKDTFEATIRPKFKQALGDREVTMIHGDILQANISDADIIFMNSTCFQDDLMAALEQKLEEVRPNAQIISLSKPLRSPAYYQYKHKMYDFSWGQATAFYHRKRLWKVYE
jgi:SAM-dependent methyltransferase